MKKEDAQLGGDCDRQAIQLVKGPIKATFGKEAKTKSFFENVQDTEQEFRLSRIRQA